MVFLQSSTSGASASWVEDKDYNVAIKGIKMARCYYRPKGWVKERLAQYTITETRYGSGVPVILKVRCLGLLGLEGIII